MSFIPFHRPLIGEEEIAEVVDTLRSGWLSSGPKVKRFEEEFAAQVGAKHAIAVNSCTAGLHLSLEAIGLEKDDFVVTTPLTFAATAEVIRYFGAHPLFVDIDVETGNIDPDLIEIAIHNALHDGKKVKAIVPVHFAGRPCSMGQIMRIAEKYGIKVIEDAAHAFPSCYAGRMIGSIGDLTNFSFYATKTITTGEGGMVTTNNDEYADRIRKMRLHGVDRDIWNRYNSDKPKWYYLVTDIGYKYNMSDVAAAMGIQQLKKAGKFRQDRLFIAYQYHYGLKDMPLILPNSSDLPLHSVHSWHLYVIRFNRQLINIDRDQFIVKMAERGIGTSVHFIPLHLHPYWKDKYGFKTYDFPLAMNFYESCVSLPIYPGLSDECSRRVINTARDIIHNWHES